MTLALMAGEGALPGALLAEMADRARDVLLCELRGHPIAPELRAGRPVLTFRLETLGSFIADLRARSVSAICFAGRVSRPEIDPAQIDAATKPLVPRMAQALQAGDDTALRVLAALFEEAGIQVSGVGDLAPGLLASEAVLTRAAPAEIARTDAGRGMDIIAALAAVDVGQACVVADGQALAVEATAGTDWMLGTLTPSGEADDWAAARLQRAKAAYGGARGGVLVKAAKPGQDLRFDLPTVGPETVDAAARAGLAGIVVEAGRVLILERETMIGAADAAGLFIWARG